MVQSINTTLISKVMRAFSILSSPPRTELLTHPSRGQRTSSNCIQTLLSCLPRACESLSSVLLLDPIHGGGHAEHAHEAAGRLLVAGRNRTPLLEPGPETLDAVAVHVDPGRARDGRLIALGRDRWTRAELPDEVAECLTGVAAIGHNPGRDEGEKRQEQWGQRQFVRLPGSQGEANGATGGIGDHASLGSKTAARTAKPLTRVALCCSSPFLAAPAALWGARILVPSRNAIPASTPPRRCAASSNRSQTPSRDQRPKVCAAIHHGPSSTGIWRHFAPLSCRQMIASIVRRRS